MVEGLGSRRLEVDSSMVQGLGCRVKVQGLGFRAPLSR